MKLHDRPSTSREECPDSVWELIPWYVNGSLPADQVELVKAHSKTCTSCAVEIARQRQVADDVVKKDPFEAPLARSWDTLRAQIEAEDKARAPQPAGRNWFAGLNGGVVALMGAGAAACLVVVFQISQPNDNGFVTLTNGAENAAQLIKFQPADGLDTDAITALLASQGVSLVSGPSAAGVYTASVPEGTNPVAAADALMALPDVVFAAPEIEQ